MDTLFIEGLVLDADVLQAASIRGTADDHAEIALCTLASFEESKHLFILCDALYSEWQSHLSSYSSRWWVAMESSERIIHVGRCNLAELRNEIESLDSTQYPVRAMIKDIHLLESAHHASRCVVSNDTTSRNAYRRASSCVACHVKQIAWVVPREFGLDKIRKWIKLNQYTSIGCDLFETS